MAKKTKCIVNEHGRECSCCGKFKPWEEFCRDGAQRNNRSSKCKQCFTRYNTTKYLIETRFRGVVRDWCERAGEKLPFQLTGVKIFEILGITKRDLLKSYEGKDLHSYHIDHIVPRSVANTVEELFLLMHHTNTQLLPRSENQAKSANINTQDVAKVASMHPRGEEIRKMVERHMEEKKK